MYGFAWCALGRCTLASMSMHENECGDNTRVREGSCWFPLGVHGHQRRVDCVAVQGWVRLEDLEHDLAHVLLVSPCSIFQLWREAFLLHLVLHGMGGCRGQAMMALVPVRALQPSSRLSWVRPVGLHKT